MSFWPNPELVRASAPVDAFIARGTSLGGWPAWLELGNWAILTWTALPICLRAVPGRLRHFFVLRFLLAAEAEDVVPGLLQRVGGREIALTQGGAFADGIEDTGDGKRVGLEDA